VFGIDFSKALSRQKLAAVPAYSIPLEDRITVTRDSATGEWVLEMSPGLDLMEVARVVGVIQSRALELLQRQCAMDAGSLPSPPAVDQSLTDTVEF
jgi:hypothetical protein